MRPELQDAIRAEQLAAGFGIDATEAIHRLALRYAEATKYYLSSKAAHREEIELVLRELTRLLVLLVLLESVRQRVAGPLREIPNDPERNANIIEWRRLTEELPPQIRKRVDAAMSLLERMCGITSAQLEQIDYVGKLIASTWLPGREKQLKTAREKADAAAITDHERVRDSYLAVLAVLKSQLGRCY